MRKKKTEFIDIVNSEEKNREEKRKNQSEYCFEFKCVLTCAFVMFFYVKIYLYIYIRIYIYVRDTDNNKKTREKKEEEEEKKKVKSTAKICKQILKLSLANLRRKSIVTTKIN